MFAVVFVVQSDEENCTVDADGKKFVVLLLEGLQKKGCYLDLHDEAAKSLVKHSSVVLSVKFSKPNFTKF